MFFKILLRTIFKTCLDTLYIFIWVNAFDRLSLSFNSQHCTFCNTEVIYGESLHSCVFKMRYNFSALNWQGVYKQILTHIEKCSFYYLKSMVFENHPKSRIWIFQFWQFLPIFVLLKLTCLVTLFDRKLQVFKNSSKWTNFGIFN